MRRAFGDAVISTAALLLLLLILVSVDDRVRDQVSGVVHGTPSSSQIAGVGRQVRDVAGVVLEALQEQSVEHAPMMIFALAATVLTLFMLRT